MAAQTDDKLVNFPKERKPRQQRKPRQKVIANLEAERNTLGSILIASADASGMDDRVIEAVDLLEPGDFYEPRYQLIFEAIQALRMAGKPFGDFVLVDEYLNAHGKFKDAGGNGAVYSLASETVNSHHVLEYARVVFDTSIKRQTQTISTEGVQLDIEPDELAERLRKLVERRQRAEQHVGILPGRKLSEVQKEAVHWAWPGRLAFGKATILDGDGGKGKGLITLDIAGRATTGRPMPGETEAAPPMNVILIAPEDNAADTLRPRLEAAGGDPSRVRLLDAIETVNEKGEAVTRPFTIPSDVPLLEEVITRDNAKLVIIDPIMSCLDAGVKTGIDNDVRAALMPLKQAIERTGAILVLVRHFTKSSETRAAYRGGGSVAFTNIARFGLVVADHPDNPDMGVMALAKTNYAKVGPLAYRVVQGAGDVRVEWVEGAAANLDADTLLSARGSNERREVVEVLEEAAPEWLTIKEINERLPERLPEATLRKRLSRYADSKTILSKPGAGLYGALSCNPTPLEEVSHMSYQSQVSQVSQVSQHASLDKQSSCDSVTVVTPLLRCDTSTNGSVTDSSSCEHPEEAMQMQEDGALRCTQCGGEW